MAEATQVTDGETVGVSPKAIIAAAAPFMVGLVLLILDMTELAKIEDGLWAGLLGIAPVVAGGGAAVASTGKVKTRTHPRKRRKTRKLP